MKIAIRPGHLKKGRRFDVGSCGPEGCESDWVLDLALALERELRARGHDVLIVDSGENSERAAKVDACGAALSIHVHGDTGRPKLYSYPGNLTGASYTMAVAQALSWTRLDPGGPSWTWGAADPSAVPRAYDLLGQERCTSILLELVQQTDGPDVRWLRDHLDDVARCIAEGIRDASPTTPC